MHRNLLLQFLFILAVFGCEENPCEDLNNGVYNYPVDKARGKSLEESVKIYKIPNQVLRCITTEGLIRSCLTYPEMRMIWAHSHLQGGFDMVESMCNGFEELWSRIDKFEKLFGMYKQLNIDGRDWPAFTDLENGKYLDNINRHEIILAQNEILLDLTPKQKLDLFQLTLDNQVSKVELIEYYGTVGMETSLAILSRIMYNDQYQSFIKECNNDEILRIHVEYMKVLNTDIIERIMTMSEEYLTFLKEQKK